MLKVSVLLKIAEYFTETSTINNLQIIARSHLGYGNIIYDQPKILLSKTRIAYQHNVALAKRGAARGTSPC